MVSIDPIDDDEGYPYTIDKETFFDQANKIASGFFNDNFSKAIKSIKVSSNDRASKTLLKLRVVFEVTFDDSFSNFLNIVHGGSIAILFENIINVFLYLYTEKSYSTLSSNIIYKSQIYLNAPYQIILQIDKLQFKTVFIEGTIIEINTLKSLSNTYPCLNIINEVIPSTSVSLIKELVI